MRFTCSASLILFAATASTVTAQPQQREGTYEGTVKGIRGNFLIVEVDGQTGPVPVDAQTKLSVTATGDEGFLKPGVTMSITGSLRPDGTLTGARFTLHPNAVRSLKPEERSINAADPRLTVAARLVSREPFVVQTLEPITITRDGRPVSRTAVGQNLKVTLANKELSEVDIALGPVTRLIEEGDDARLTFKKDRPAATAVTVKKAKPMSSKPAENGKKKDASAESADSDGKEESDKVTDE